MTEPLFPAQIVAIELAAQDILSFHLRPIDPSAKIVVDPGSHLDVQLPGGVMRSYSLSNTPLQRKAYRLTVARDAKSRGGSTYMHDALRVGQIVEISAPRNNFRLAEDAGLSVFFAGGIGVTPFVPMIARLNALGKKWRLHYCVRDRSRAALVDDLAELEAGGGGEFLLNCDDVDGILDLRSALAAAPSDAHLYCCGPMAMLDSFRKYAGEAGFVDSQVHFEYFSADVQTATEGGFVVALNKSGRELSVEPGETILQALVKNGVSISYSCEEGICGACETRVLEGTPDHRDGILSDEEKKNSKTMMVCCSGSKSPRLVLDL